MTKDTLSRQHTLNTQFRTDLDKLKNEIDENWKYNENGNIGLAKGIDRLSTRITALDHRLTIRYSENIVKVLEPCPYTTALEARTRKSIIWLAFAIGFIGIAMLMHLWGHYA